MEYKNPQSVDPKNYPSNTGMDGATKLGGYDPKSPNDNISNQGNPNNSNYPNASNDNSSNQGNPNNSNFPNASNDNASNINNPNNVQNK